MLSDSSSKQTPTLCAFTDEERLIGDSAMNQIRRNFKNSIQFFPRLLGLNATCEEQLAEEEKFLTVPIKKLENNKIAVEVTNRGSLTQLTPEQLMAMYLKKVFTFFAKSGINSKDLVISVPAYYSNVERQAMLDACSIANLKCVRLINECTATALAYGFFRKADLDEKKPRNVAFVDFGHSKLTCFVASFVKGSMKIIVHKSDRNLGARNIDFLFVDRLGEEFKKKYGCDPRKNHRTRLRMLDALEKARKILSAN